MLDISDVNVRAGLPPVEGESPGQWPQGLESVSGETSVCRARVKAQVSPPAACPASSAVQPPSVLGIYSGLGASWMKRGV